MSTTLTRTLWTTLHCSRRIQARRILRQYEHLIAHLNERISYKLNRNSGDQELLVPSSPDQVKLARLPAPGEFGWLVVVAVAFIIIHIAAGTIWLRASANEATASRYQAISPLYD